MSSVSRAGLEVVAHAVEDRDVQRRSVDRVVERIARHVVRGFEGATHADDAGREAQGWQQRPAELGAERQGTETVRTHEVVGELALRDEQPGDERGECLARADEVVVPRGMDEEEHAQTVDAVAHREPDACAGSVDFAGGVLPLVSTSREGGVDPERVGIRTVVRRERDEDALFDVGDEDRDRFEPHGQEFARAGSAGDRAARGSALPAAGSR